MALLTSSMGKEGRNGILRPAKSRTGASFWTQQGMLSPSSVNQVDRQLQRRQLGIKYAKALKLDLSNPGLLVPQEPGEVDRNLLRRKITSLAVSS